MSDALPRKSPRLVHDDRVLVADILSKERRQHKVDTSQTKKRSQTYRLPIYEITMASPIIMSSTASQQSPVVYFEFE